jgi:hypothetical protein
MQKTLIILLLVIAGNLATAADYKLDTDGAQHLMNIPSKLPNPTQVNIYLNGPKVGPTKPSLWPVIPSERPDYTTTNQEEIAGLMITLRRENDKLRIEDQFRLKGYTYFLVLFQETNHTVVQVSIFEPLNYKTKSCSILPQDGVGSIYYNEQIGEWLHSRVKVPAKESR